jgi:(1->4)-alpha-D-glucan 1-alpha-D-glucosylmutase
MNVPRATMRLQFHSCFTFQDAIPLVPYLAALGISHLYASPILTARPGSMHGYDVVDPSRVNPELGGEEDFRRLVHELRRHEMGAIVDIVPNHMAIGANNRWWMDVLAHGQTSRYAKFFDIDWSPPAPNLRGKVALPILGRPYGEALAAGELKVDTENNETAWVRYFDHKLPLAPNTIADLNGDGDSRPDGPSAKHNEHLHRLLEAQHYRLMWWRSANDEINWRRFFDINELAAIRVEDDEVFEAVHSTIFRLYAEGLIDGLRVDHIDGLSRPGEYCRKMRQRLDALESVRPARAPRGNPYFVVEKILAGDERVPREWETDGTTGYDFMDEISAVQHDKSGERGLGALWERISGRSSNFADEEELARRQILQRSFAAQHEATVEALYALAQSDLTTRDWSRSAIRRCLTEILAHFPVYRIYTRAGHASRSDLQFLARALVGAKSTCLLGDCWLVDAIGEWLSGKRIRAGADLQQDLALARFEQLSAPLCAKAVEDTAFYRYGRLISRNDVGFDARAFACSAGDFHRRMQARVESPRSLLATATHDHKRGEDVRARLAVLSECADDWAEAAERWLRLSEPHCTILHGVRAPSAGDRAILFQTIVGAWPLTLLPTDREGLAAYRKRIAAWQQKALREAKLFSDWSAPNEDYEGATDALLSWLFSESSAVLWELAAFADRISPAGAANSLAQVLVRLTAPGVPDTYQGTEYWDFSLVDPDNRAPVDFASRQQTLGTAPSDAAADWTDGRIKQAMIARVLSLRKEMPRVFNEGSYLPLQVSGVCAEHVLAYARLFDGMSVIAAICRLPAALLKDDRSLRIPPTRWDATHILIPQELRGITFANSLHCSEEIVTAEALEPAQVFSHLPIAFLVSRPK